MDESTDVDRMLARLGETNLQYREFTDASTKPPRSWGAEVEPVPPVVIRRPDEPLVTPVPSGWNTSRPAPLAPEPLLVDPEAPGGRQAGIHLAQVSGGVTADAIAEGRTPPAPVDRAVAPLPVASPALPASAVVPPASGLNGMFSRVSRGEAPAATAAPASAPLASLFKRIS